jgi:hypothetical protein
MRILSVSDMSRALGCLARLVHLGYEIHGFIIPILVEQQGGQKKSTSSGVCQFMKSIYMTVRYQKVALHCVYSSYHQDTHAQDETDKLKTRQDRSSQVHGTATATPCTGHNIVPIMDDPRGDTGLL